MTNSVGTNIISISNLEGIVELSDALKHSYPFEEKKLDQLTKLIEFACLSEVVNLKVQVEWRDEADASATEYGGSPSLEGPVQ